MKKKIFITGFWLCLVLPGILHPVIKKYIDSKNYEKRVYADFPRISDGRSFLEFPKGFDAWYNDRVPFKNQFVRLNTRLDEWLSPNEEKSLMEFMGGMELVTRGKEGWLFLTNIGPEEDSIRDYLGINLYSEEELEELAAYYQEIHDYYNSKGIEFVLFVPPNKEQIYNEYMPENVVMTTGETRTGQAVDFLQEHTDVNAIYAKEALREAKQFYQVYYKYDTHWNSIGAFVGTQLLTGLLKGTSMPIQNVLVEEIDFSGRLDLAAILGIVPDCTDDREYWVCDYKSDVLVEVVEEEPGVIWHYKSNAEDKRSVLVLQDSFGEAMQSHLPKEFAEVTFIPDTSWQLARQILAENPPDIFVLEILERRRASFRELAGWLLEEESQ